MRQQIILDEEEIEEAIVQWVAGRVKTNFAADVQILFEENHTLLGDKKVTAKALIVLETSDDDRPDDKAVAIGFSKEAS